MLLKLVLFVLGLDMRPEQEVIHLREVMVMRKDLVAHWANHSIDLDGILSENSGEAVIVTLISSIIIVHYCKVFVFLKLLISSRQIRLEELVPIGEEMVGENFLEIVRDFLVSLPINSIWMDLVIEDDFVGKLQEI